MSLDNIFQSFPQVDTRNLILRRIQLTDSNALFRILGDDEVTRYYADTTFAEVSHARDQIETWENGFICKTVRSGSTAQTGTNPSSVNPIGTDLGNNSRSSVMLSYY